MRKMLVLALALAALPAEAETMKPGLWEITTRSVGIPGMPPEMAAAMPARTMTTRQCLKPEDVAGGPARLSGQPGEDCRVIRQDQKGASFESTIACGAGDEAVTIKAKGTATATSYEGSSEIAMAEMDEPLTSTFSGRLVGPCP